jgi:hypothetical protein
MACCNAASVVQQTAIRNVALDASPALLTSHNVDEHVFHPLERSCAGAIGSIGPAAIFFRRRHLDLTAKVIITIDPIPIVLEQMEASKRI